MRIDEALSVIREAVFGMSDREKKLDELFAMSPQFVRFPDAQWRSTTDQAGFPTEGKVWISDGTRVWDVWAHGGIDISQATACKFWLDGYVWPAPPTAERVAELSADAQVNS